jgi:outer membrane protein
LQEAQLEIDRSRMELAVIIFPNFNENFSAVDDLENLQPLPSFQEAEAQAGKQNPQLAAALASLRAANQEVAVAWNSFLPSLGFDYFYGIDANQFATKGIDDSVFPHRRVNNLGYSAVATLDIPIWNWGASSAKVKSAHLQRDQAKRKGKWSPTLRFFIARHKPDGPNSNPCASPPTWPPKACA